MIPTQGERHAGQCRPAVRVLHTRCEGQGRAMHAGSGAVRSPCSSPAVCRQAHAARGVPASACAARQWNGVRRAACQKSWVDKTACQAGHADRQQTCAYCCPASPSLHNTCTPSHSEGGSDKEREKDTLPPKHTNHLSRTGQPSYLQPVCKETKTNKPPLPLRTYCPPVPKAAT